MSIDNVLLDLDMIGNLVAGDVSLQNEKEHNVVFSEKIHRARNKIENVHKGLTKLLVTIEQAKANQTIPECRDSIKDFIKILEEPLSPISVKK